MSKPYKRPDSKFWWIAPMISGTQVRQSSGYELEEHDGYENASRRLKILEGKIAAGAAITPKTDRGSFQALLELVRTDYKMKRRASLYDLEKRIDLHIGPALGAIPSRKVKRSTISEYILARQSEESEPANATINRELAIIKRGFKLGIEDEVVSSVPKIEMLPENNVRQGYFTDKTFHAVLAKANLLLHDILTVAYYTGWRIASILRLEWSNVDWSMDVVRLRGNQTKNGKATVFPLAPFPELKAALLRREEEKNSLKKAMPPVLTPWVFHRNGQRVASIRKAWELTRERANCTRIIHDLRRTAVMNLKSGGWSDTEIMNMVGLKTLNMLIRYGITTENTILEKARTLAKAAASQN